MRKRIKDVVEKNALLLFFISSIITLILFVYIVIEYKIVAFQALSLLYIIYYIYKVIYYEMFGVLND